MALPVLSRHSNVLLRVVGIRRATMVVQHE
jgi:hypothetical protein